ncbi:MAG: SDR family oxidoreductase [Paludibacteraceae bacterium]|nr:SDR family oxidoreductase [Paludibacteraceae bacterium]
MKIKGTKVLITGGASGIGKIMGRIALDKGADSLIIWDVNQQNLDAVVTEFSSKGKVYGYLVDVSDFEMVQHSYQTVKKECGNVDILINCAGVVTSNNHFFNLNVSDIDRTMKINAIVPMYVTLPFLKDMVERDRGHICTIASAAGMLSNPRMSVYAASKWAALGWSESIRIELKEMKSNVKSTTIAPYYISTGMFDGVQSRLFPILEPEKVANKIIKAIESNRNFKGMPFGFHFIRFLQGILPFSWFDYIIGNVCGVYHTMDNFTGRKKS